MPKLIKVVFFILSILLVCALVIACASVVKMNSGSGDEDSSLSDSDSSVLVSQEPSADDSSTVISEESHQESSGEADSSMEETTEEPSEEESSALISEDSSEEPSEDSSEEVPPAVDKGTDPITPPPSGIVASDKDVYFNDSLFIGHSVMVHFKGYVSNWRKSYGNILGDASFGCTSSFGFYNNIHQSPSDADNVLPKYAGQAYKIEDLVKVKGPKTVYLGLMGLNDLGMVGKPDTCAALVAEEVEQCIAAIKEKSPDVTVVVLASTYLVRDVSYPKLNNRNMSMLNSYVLDYCNKNGIDFVDVATPLVDGGGYLASVYCSDNYCHLNESAYYVWMDVLRNYAEQKENGTWKNPESIPMFNQQ